MLLDNKALLKALGYTENDRLLIIHADDAGMCHDMNQAITEALEVGIVKSASLMAPCPWFNHMASFCKEHPQFDYGIHLTLTSEWEQYKWQPTVNNMRLETLTDDNGYFYRTEDEVRAHAQPDEILTELESQLKRIKEQGVNITHIDNHMFTLFHKPFFEHYLLLAKRYNLLPMIPAVMPESMQPKRRPDILSPEALNKLRQEGYFILDSFQMLKDLADEYSLESRREKYYQLFKNLPSGISYLSVHLSINSGEIKNITKRWHLRWLDYLIFIDPNTLKYLNTQGIHLIDFQSILPVWKDLTG